jgi:flavin reductase (DIM6/NTAB) family NADH-FMN oxidoreductase RutF
MLHIAPGDVPVKDVHNYLLGGVGPRPIALVATCARDGQANLSPFSFFNAFGANPPTVAFSPSRRVRDASTKDTYANLLMTQDCTINAVTYDMVQQVSLASTEYPAGVNEFTKTGLTPVPSDIVHPPRVAESPFQMECKLLQMVTLGDKNGSGNLAICEVVKFHIAEDIIVNGVIDPQRIDLVARMSGDYYCRASGASIFKVKKPLERKGIGYDALPEFIRKSDVFTANNVAQFGNTMTVPGDNEIDAFIQAVPTVSETLESFCRYERLGEYQHMLRAALALLNEGHPRADRLLELTARRALDFDDSEFAWKTALYAQRVRGGKR